MKKTGIVVSLLCMALMATGQTVGNSYYFDFGMDGSSRGELTEGPDVNGHYWNNISQVGTNNKVDQSASYSLVDADSLLSDYTLTLTGAAFTCNGMSGGGGLLAPSVENLGDLAIATATEDYFFASNSEHCTILLKGLDVNKGYQFKIFGSRSATDVRIADYTLRGRWAVQGSLQVAGTDMGGSGINQNTGDIYTSPIIFPDADGTISITVHRQYAGSGAYFPINCMRMQEITNVPSPACELYIDCGHSDGSNGELTPSPDAGGIYWNNLSDNTTSAAAVSLVSTDNTATGIQVTITGSFQRNGYNNGGCVADAYSEYLHAFGQKSVMGDYFFVSASGNGKMLFSGMNPNKAYVFSVIGSRAYNSSFGQTVARLNISGLNNSSFTHHTGGNGLCYSGATNGWNEDAFSVSEPVFPNEQGEITLSLTADRGSYVHINAIRIEEYTGLIPSGYHTSLTLAGTGVEDNTVQMHLLGAKGATQSKHFETFCQLTQGGSIQLMDENSEVLYASTVAEETGIYRVQVNTDNPTPVLTKITRMGFVGNITTEGWTPSGMEMTYVGHGVWQEQLELPAYSGSDAERGEWCFNSSWDAQIKMFENIEGAVGISDDATLCGFAVNDVYQSHGTLNVTLDLRNFTYSFQCVDIDETKITFFGSSVCHGQGAANMQGYAYQYMQTNDRFTYSNTSINGNNTTNLLNRFQGHLIGDCGRYVVIGLGLGNEGLHEATDKQAIYNQWKTNMQQLIRQTQDEGKQVVVTNNYPRGDYDADDYAYVKQMNIEMNTWGVPVVNFLGALDNCEGNGQWATGYQVDGDIYHPNDLGHTELMHSIVPSLFDALAQGVSLPSRQTTQGTDMSSSSLSFTPEGTIHSFTIALRVKAAAAVAVVRLITSDGNRILSLPAEEADGEWHTIAISHYYAAGKTYYYVDGALKQTVDEQLVLQSAAIEPVKATVADLMLFRAGMNREEHAVLCDASQEMLASMELYCPLNDGEITNYAQSLNTLTFQSNVTTSTENTLQNDANNGYYDLLGRKVDIPAENSIVITPENKKIIHL
ncbi:MAG: SGNH/GDSL hydrolase family protein [Paludibacteraceae bacterium]